MGAVGIGDFINIHFKSKQLADAIKSKNIHAMLYFVYNTKIATILVNHSIEHSEFVLQTPYFPPIQDIKDLTPQDCKNMILNSINPGSGNDSSDSEVTIIDDILNVGHWNMSACVSDVFGDHQKNIYIAGDAGHSVSPAGGYGMNSGICDVHNLAHKIADAEFNFNKSALKDYEIERKFINKLTARYSHQNFNKGEKIVNKLGVDLKTFKNLSKTMNTLTESFIPGTIRKGVLDFTIKTAQQISMNPYFIKKKIEYLKTYENGIALLFPNLDYSYAYPTSAKQQMEVENFLDLNYDQRDYKLVNSIGSLLPLFSFWCPETKQSYASREYIYLYQNEEKRPFYFLFKFGTEDQSSTGIEWLEGNQELIHKVVDDDKIYLHVT